MRRPCPPRFRPATRRFTWESGPRRAATWPPTSTILRSGAERCKGLKLLNFRECHRLDDNGWAGRGVAFVNRSFGEAEHPISDVPTATLWWSPHFEGPAYVDTENMEDFRGEI